ncbi:MAG: hypothetical protein HYZ69_00575, partial [Candidatus Colwellbacteria bacterium]|nr:hypothetical protein [Candidatus Colwellbacteria bacterium]
MDEKNNYFIPFSIVIAGILIAGAVWFGPAKSGTTLSDDGVGDGVNRGVAQALKGGSAMRPVGANDHIRGNPE